MAALEAKLVQKLSQSLLMTPQLQHAIKLLQLGRLEYQEAIEKELLENPVLEEIRESEEEGGDRISKLLKELAEKPTPENGVAEAAPEPERRELAPAPEPEARADRANDESPVAWEDYLEHFTDSRGSATPRGSIDFEDRPSLEGTLSKSANLAEHLLEQLRLADIPEKDNDIVMQVVGNLDKDGYLCLSYEEIAQSCGRVTGDVERVMEVFKSLDPPGVGARDLKECLLIQLENLGLEGGLEAKIVREHLDKLEKRKYDQIAKSAEVELEEVYRAVSIIQRLEPRPGRPFIDDTTRYIVPDVYVYKVGEEYVIALNDDGLPKLRVSPYYLELLKRKGMENSADKHYLNERLKAASWLIKSIHQRQQTIYRVTESIVKFQREFLNSGIARLKPLVLRDVADDIGMHESTVSRVTTNKYVHTPQGVFELKFFFSTGIKTATGEISSSTIKDRIKTLITAEPPDDPLSDQKIVEILRGENIKIARRTVAKYREMLGILASSKRKRPF